VMVEPYRRERAREVIEKLSRYTVRPSLAA